MFRTFRQVVQKNGFRGWRLETLEDELYFSKFDDNYNDDEYRFFIQNDLSNIQIYKMDKVKNYKKIMKVKPNNKYLKEAQQICELLEKQA